MAFNKDNKKEGGWCRGKLNNNNNDEYEEKDGRHNRINSKINTISVEDNNNREDDEDF